MPAPAADDEGAGAPECTCLSKRAYLTTCWSKRAARSRTWSSLRPIGKPRSAALGSTPRAASSSAERDAGLTPRSGSYESRSSRLRLSNLACLDTTMRAVRPVRDADGLPAGLMNIHPLASRG